MKKMLAFVLLNCCLLTGCHYVHPFHVDISQGKKLTMRQVKQLKTGMTQRQVTKLIGKPLLDNPFHQDRWHYVYYHRPSFGYTTRKRLVIYFKNNRVTRIDSDYHGASATKDGS